MKLLICLLFAISSSVFAQDPTNYLKNFDAKVYSLKSKGVKDFVVDIESSRLTKQMNEMQVFGRVKELIFRVYWTANPERAAIEIIGLPEGFREVKEELKVSLIGMLDSIIPQTFAQRFHGYKFTQGATAKEIIAKDNSGIAPVPTYVIKFDNQDKLIEVDGIKPVGTLVTTPIYEKEAFSDGKWVLKKQTTTTSENGQSLTITKTLAYTLADGMGVVKEVGITTEQKLPNSDSKPVSISESITFEKYKINTGEALKYFLGESAPSKEASDTAPKKAQ